MEHRVVYMRCLGCISLLFQFALLFFFFFFNDTATTEIYTLSLHDALPIFAVLRMLGFSGAVVGTTGYALARECSADRSEEHTSELQSPCNLVCRLLLEKKKKQHSALAHDSTVQRQTGHRDTVSPPRCACGS